MYVVAMIKGEYQIKKIDAQNEIKKEGDKKSTSERLSIPFTFDRTTEVGLIEPGDMFFGCVTSDEFPDQNSDCEKRIITDLSKQGQLWQEKIVPVNKNISLLYVNLITTLVIENSNFLLLN